MAQITVDLPTLEDAKEVVNQLRQLITKYGAASVNDFFTLVGVTGTFKDEKLGWKEIVHANIEMEEGKFRLFLPEPVPIFE